MKRQQIAGGVIDGYHLFTVIRQKCLWGFSSRPRGALSKALWTGVCVCGGEKTLTLYVKMCNQLMANTRSKTASQ